MSGVDPSGVIIGEDDAEAMPDYSYELETMSQIKTTAATNEEV